MAAKKKLPLVKKKVVSKAATEAEKKGAPGKKGKLGGVGKITFVKPDGKKNESGVSSLQYLKNCITAKMEDMGLSQGDLAKKTGLHRSNVCRFFHSDNWTLKMLVKISKALSLELNLRTVVKEEKGAPKSKLGASVKASKFGVCVSKMVAQKKPPVFKKKKK